MKIDIEKIDFVKLAEGMKLYQEILKNGFSKSSKLDLGKQIKWIKCKDMPNQCVHILEIREIEGKQFVCLISRKFHSNKMHDWTDTLVQTEPYTSDDDFKKFEMYNQS